MDDWDNDCDNEPEPGPMVCIRIKKNIHDEEFQPATNNQDHPLDKFSPNDYFPADCGSMANGSSSERNPMDQFLLSELGQVQRKYRKADETGRQILANGSTMSRNRGQLLDILKKAKENIQADLDNAGSPENLRRNVATHQKVLALVEDCETIQESIGMATKELEETTRNLDKIVQKLQQQKLAVKKIFGVSPSPAKSEKKIESLENRLYQMVSQFDIVIHKNRAERTEIRTMMKSRGHFFKKCQYYKGKIHYLKDQMNQLAKSSDFDYDQRDDLRTNMQQKMVMHDRDAKNFHREMKDVSRILDNEDKVHKFMNTKDQERPSGEERVSRRTLQTLENLHRTIRNYKLTFSKILELANSRDENALIREYRSREQINFKQFKKISELDCETLKIYDNIVKKVKNVEDLYEERKEKKQLWKGQLADIYCDVLVEDGQVRSLAEKLQICNQDEDNFLPELDKLFKMAKCDDSGILRLLGKHDGVNSRNADLCMSILEKKVDDMVQRKKKLELRKAYEVENNDSTKNTKFANRRLSFDPKSTGGPYVPPIVMSSFLIDEDEEEEIQFEEKVYTYQEMRDLVKKMLENAQTIETMQKNSIRIHST